MRSKSVIFLPFCTLCQASKARGLARTYSAQLEPLLDLLAEENINIVQLPCPEMLFEGIDREPRDISYYENREFKQSCRRLAEQQAVIINQFKDAGYNIIALVGVERSPSCSLRNVKRKGKIIRGKGIFMDYLVEECPSGVPLISLDYRAQNAAIYMIEESIINMKRP